MKMKKWLAASAGITLIASVLTGCGDSNTNSSSNTPAATNADTSKAAQTGFPISKDPISLKFFVSKRFDTQNFNDILVWNEYKKMTNVNVQWTDIIREQATEKRNLALASGDLPDVFYGQGFSAAELLKYGQQGTFVKLNDLIDKYAPNLKKIMDKDPNIKKAITMADGNIYSMPQLTDPNFKANLSGIFLWYQQSWLDKVGMSTPKTTDEFYTFLKKVKETDPNMIPIGGAAIGNLLNIFKGSWGLGNHGKTYANFDLDPKTNALRFIPTAPEYKEVLQYLNKLYAEGLLDKNTFSGSSDQLIANGQQGKYAVHPGYDPGPVWGQNGYVGGVTLKGPHGDEIYANMGSNVGAIGQFAITKNNKNPEATMRWVDYFYSDEGSKLFFLGVEGTTYKKLADGSYDFIDSIKKDPTGLTQDQAAGKFIIYPGLGHPSYRKQEYFKGAEGTAKSIQAMKNVESQVPKEVWPTFVFNQEEADRMAPLQKDIETYVNEMQAKFVTGNVPFTDWDKFVSTLQKMGLEDYMKIYKSGLDRYSKK